MSSPKLTGEYDADVKMLLEEIEDLQRNSRRWIYVSKKLCLTGNGNGTCSMHAVNLPQSIPGWPDFENIEEFCEVAIDSAIGSET